MIGYTLIVAGRIRQEDTLMARDLELMRLTTQLKEKTCPKRCTRSHFRDRALVIIKQSSRLQPHESLELKHDSSPSQAQNL